MNHRKEIRLKDIARELNISIVSVSNALNGKKGVGEELRQKVKDKAEELGYEVPQRFRHNSEKGTDGCCIGIMAAEGHREGISSFHMNIYKEIVRYVTEQGGLTVLEFAESYADAMGRCFTGMEIAGIIFLGEMDMEFIRGVQSGKNVPAVGIDFYVTDGGMDYIVPDYFHEAQHMMQRLIDAGHREAGFTENPYGSEKMTDCYMGYCSALQINGIEEYKTENKNAGKSAGMQPYSHGIERILARSGVDLLMKRVCGENTGYSIRIVSCHA